MLGGIHVRPLADPSNCYVHSEASLGTGCIGHRVPENLRHALDSAEPMWHFATKSARSRWASVLASTMSFFMLGHAIALILNGLASCSGMLAFSKASAVFIQWFPMDSHTTVHSQYCIPIRLTNSETQVKH